MDRKRIKNSIWVTCLALACTLGVGFARIEAQAQTQTSEDVLLVPDSYQQYLELTAPVDVAVSERYVAIADKNLVYVYDGVGDVYRAYEHNYNVNNPASNNLSKLQFDEDGNLYFLDQHELFVLPFDTLDNVNDGTVSATETGFACTTFLAVGDTLYFTDAKAGNTQLLETTIENLIPNKQNRITIVETGLTGIPALAFNNGELYFTRTSGYSELYKFNPSVDAARPIQSLLDVKIAEFNYNVSSIAVAHDTLVISTETKEFYTYALPRANEDTLLSTQSGAFTALCAFQNFVYAVNGDSVWQYNLTLKAFTDFEICANSARDNRLDGATDVLQVGNRLFVADSNNHRVSVFNTETESFEKSFNATLPITFLSSDGSILCAASENQVALYALDDAQFGTQIALFEGFEDPIIGVASVYGNHYFATATHAYRAAYSAETDAFVLSDSEKLTFHPSLLSSDIYGNLYTFKSGQLFRYTEDEFMSSDGVGEVVATTSLTNIKKLVFDYEGNAYALKDNDVYALSSDAKFSFETPRVYTGAIELTAFTFGVEENAGYLLCNGNHLVKTAAFMLPTVKTINVEHADEQIFEESSVAVSVVRVRENALLVEFDLSLLRGAAHFPYLSYCRTTQPCTALQLGETSSYTLIAVFDQTANEYHTYAVKKQFCQPVPQTDYFVAYENGKDAWMTNDVTLYKFPYLTQLLTVTTAERGAHVTLLGEINDLDHDYYLVQIVDENGVTAQGYIPKPYCSTFNSTPTPPTQIVIGDNVAADDSVPRAIYLLLGFAIICILVDFLLLRKHDEEES